jgi:anaerobic magnesium-protoporphyrin IX monomethyl ester cyclase
MQNMPLKIFLGNGPWYKPGYYGVRAGSRWPHFEETGNTYLPFPFYLAYAAAILEREGYTCRMVDGVAERISEDAYIRRAVEFKPDVTILEVSTASFETDLRQARRIKEHCPSTRLAFCGLHVDMYRPAFLEEHPEVDFVLKGEYDLIIHHLLRAISDGDYSKVPSLIYRSAAGAYTENEANGETIDLDSIPWPARHHLPMLNYWDLPGGIPAPSLQMWSSRGCPFQCIFCAWPQIMYGNHQYRTRNPIAVVDEIEAAAKQYGFRSFYFDDDTFNIGKERILKLCDEMRRRGLKLPWAAMSRADTSDRETLIAMRDAGMMAIKYGVESGSQELVKASKKNLNLEKVEATVCYTRELGIRQHLTFSFGLPGETWETVRKTIDFAKRLNPETVQFSIMTPFPGSKFYNLLESEGKILTHDWSSYDGGTTAVIRTEALDARDLEKALHMAYREWDLHKVMRPFKDFRQLRRLLSQPKQSWHTFKFMATRSLRRFRQSLS